MNENINILGNVFENVNRGVGAHSVFQANYRKTLIFQITHLTMFQAMPFLLQAF